MAQVINTNVASLNAQRNLNMSQSSLTTSLQRLSTGLRINSAKDDAAGMAISDRMTSQIRGLNQAARNANDAISLSQTAESAIGSIGDNLQRIRELAVQSANSTNSALDRGALQNEVGQLLDEIQRVSSSTQFNGLNLLDGSFSTQKFQVGANANQTISVSLSNMSTSKLGTGDQAALSSIGAQTALGSATPLVEGDLLINGVTIGASSSANDTASFADKSSSSIAKAAAINAQSTLTGVTATVNETVLAGASMTAASTTGKLVINGQNTAIITTTGTASTDRAQVVSAINAISGQTGVVAIDTGEDTSGVKLVAADGRNISIKGFTASTLTAATTGITGLDTVANDAIGKTQTGTFTLTSSKDIVLSSGVGKTISNAGLTAGTYKAQIASVSSTSGTATALASGDVKINGVIIGASLASYDTYSTTGAIYSAISKAAAVNKATSQTGVSAVANANTFSGASMTGAVLTGTITINGVATSSFATTTNTADSRALAVSAINAISGQTGVIAIDTNADTTGVKLVAADGRNITVAYGGAATSAATGVAAAGTNVGTIRLESASEISVEAGTTPTGTTNFGIAIGKYGTGKTGQALDRVNISTLDGANKALQALDNALASINTARSSLGAYQNRFASTVANLQAVTENLSASRSRIQDTDFAAETANLTRSQILQQAGTAMLAQANALPQNVLSLLK